MNSSEPGAVVETFIAAMNAWEQEAWRAQKQCRHTSDTFSYIETARLSLQNVFEQFCTAKKRPHGRLGSFQHPPEYDPTRESVISVVFENARRAFVYTKRKALLGGGERQYVLLRKGDQWLIDKVARLQEGGWTRETL